jgi:hypothetical protein
MDMRIAPANVAIVIVIYPNKFFVNISPYPTVVIVMKMYQID